MPRVFLGNLPEDCRIEDIEDFFREYGRVRNVLIKQGKYGFCEFDRSRDAEDAVYEQHGRSLLGSRVVVELAKGPRGGEGEGRRAPWVSKYGPPQRTRYRIKVTNLSSRISWQDLKDVLRKAGEVTFAEAHTSRLHEGRVELATREDLQRVMERCQGKELNGRQIKLIQDCDSRSSSRSRSRSRSRRSRSKRSRSRGSRSRRSGSKSRSRSRSRRRTRSRSERSGRSRSRSSSKSRSKSKWRSKSRSRSRSKSKSVGNLKSNNLKSRSKSKSKENLEASKSCFKEKDCDES